MTIINSEFITQNLMPGERLICITRMHSLTLVPPAFIVGVGGLLGLVAFFGSQEAIAIAFIGFVIFLVAVTSLLTLLIKRLTTEFSCTNRRILIKSGVLNTELREMPLTQVETLLVRQGLFGKLLGYGTLIIKGSGGTRRTCKNIEKPFEFYKRVQEQVATSQKHK